MPEGPLAATAIEPYRLIQQIGKEDYLAHREQGQNRSSAREISDLH